MDNLFSKKRFNTKNFANAFVKSVDNRIFVCCDILNFLTISDMKNFIKTKQNHNIDDFQLLCYFSKGEVFPFFSKAILKKEKFIKCAIKNCYEGKTLIRFLPIEIGRNFWNKNYSDNFDEYVEYITVSTNTKRLIPDHLKYFLNDFDMSYLALKYNGCRLKQIPNHLKKNKLLLHTAFIQNGNSLLYVPNSIKSNNEYKELICICVSKYPYAFEHVGKILRADKKVIKCATNKVKWIKRFI